MLEGLEISEILLSELERTARIDSEFYTKSNIEILEILKSKYPQALTNFLQVSDGNHMSISEYFTEGQIPYYRGGDIYNFFIEQTNSPLTIPQSVYDWPHMKRSHLQKGDVLISIVGAIIGNLSLVRTDDKATCSCKLAILRPKQIESEFVAMFLKSKYGQNQIQKFRRGSGQTGLILEDFDQLLIPNLQQKFRNKIRDLSNKAFEIVENSIYCYTQAENLLLNNLGLQDFQPSVEAVNTKSLKESFLSSGRLDAEYYQPKYDTIESKLSTLSTFKIKEVFTLLSNPSPSTYRETGIKVIKTKNVRIPNIEIDNITDHTEQANLLIEKDDLLFASMGVGSLGRVSYIDKAISDCTIDGTIKLFRTKEKFKNQYIEIPTLLFLTSSIGQELIYKYVIGSTGIISISKENIENLVIPKVDKRHAKKLNDLVLESQQLKVESEKLLEVAKRAVELAIEQNEAVALAYIKENSGL